MDRRAEATEVAERLLEAIDHAGESPRSVSAATGIPISSLSNPSGLSVNELAMLGGFLRLQPSDLLAGAA